MFCLSFWPFHPKIYIKVLIQTSVYAFVAFFQFAQTQKYPYFSDHKIYFLVANKFCKENLDGSLVIINGIDIARRLKRVLEFRASQSGESTYVF